MGQRSDLASYKETSWDGWFVSHSHQFSRGGGGVNKAVLGVVKMGGEEETGEEGRGATM